MPGTPDRRRPKAAAAADGDGAALPGPPPGTDPAIGCYEALRAIALAGAGGGWRYQLPVLAARGMAAWLAQGPAVADPGAGSCQPAAMTQAGPSLSAPDPVPPDTSTNGGDARSPACTSLPLTADIVAVLAQMALHHARS
jgi:hypothetical protein